MPETVFHVLAGQVAEDAEWARRFPGVSFHKALAVTVGCDLYDAARSVSAQRGLAPAMQIARIRHEGPDGPSARIVVKEAGLDARWVDLATAERLRLERRGATRQAARRLAAAVAPPSLREALECGPAFFEAAEWAAADQSLDAVVAGDAPLIAPIDPPAYRDFMAFEAHFVTAHARGGRTVPDVLYELPVSYMGSAQSLLGPGDEVVWPPYSNVMDYELELGIVIARAGTDIAPERALDHVAGVTVLNDFSARDTQRWEMGGGLGPSKGKHFASAIGPAIVTCDELDLGQLAMTARVNGELWSQGSTSSIMWSMAELVAWASAGEHLAVGTLLGSGTVGGGCGLELGRWLKPGDVVELEIEGIGTLENRVVASTGAGWMPRPKNRSKPV